MISLWFPLVAGGLSLLLGFFVLVNGSHDKSTKWPFVAFAGLVGVWSVFVSIFSLTNSSSLAYFSVFLYYVAALFIPYGLLLFGLSYVGIKLPRYLLVVGALPLVALSIFITVPAMMIETVSVYPLHEVALDHTTYLVYCIIFIVYTLIGLAILVDRAVRSRGYDVFFSISLVICLLGGAFFNLILPWFGNYTLISFGPLFTFVMVMSVFYVIIRHGLFDIRLAVVRASTYVLSIATLAIIYLIVAFVVLNQLLGQTSSSGQNFVNVILALILAFVFQPVRRFFDKLTNRLFYKDNYNVDDFFAHINRTLTTTTDLNSLLRKAATEIKDTIKSEQVFFYVTTEHGQVLTVGTPAHTKLPQKDAEYLREHYAKSHEMIISTLLEPTDPVYRLMVSHRLELMMPLFQNELFIGYVCVGTHLATRYTNRDIRLLKTISDELVIAIQNAISVEEVHELNSTLQQRINAATKELRASNAQLQRLDEAKDEFISMASHQLRTPLTSVKGYISMVTDGDAGKINDTQKHFLDEAFLSSEKMVRLISDFLNVSRLQTGKFTIEKSADINLARVVGQEIESLQPNAAARGLKLSYSEPKKFPVLTLDEGKIRQVIMNFSDNAIYYSKEKSTIKIGLKVEGNDVVFTVQDHGIGVPVSERENLFNKFFRATNARQQRPDGTGVGLFLAKKVIDAHKGSLIFESVEGKGSTFGFRLPIA